MKKRFAVLAWTLALAACGGEEEKAPILPCAGDKVRCDPGHADQAEPEEAAQAIAVAPESLTKIQPASSLPPLGDDTLISYELASYKAGTLWEFAVQLGAGGGAYYSGEARVRFRTTTLDGDVQQGSVEAPEAASEDAHSSGVGRVRSSEGGPMVDVAWFPKCSDPAWLCPWPESLAFGADASEAPKRILWNPYKPRPWFDFYARARGRWIGLAHSAIEQRNLANELIWRQSALEDSETYLTEGAVALLENGELALLSAGSYSSNGGHGAELWRIGFDGNVKQRLGFGVPLRDTRFVHDMQERAVIAGMGLDGDIHVLRHEGGNSMRTWRFTRAPYAELSILALSVDLADTLYILAETGAPEEKNRVPVLCRVRSDDATDCFAIEKLGETMGELRKRMQATGPGIVYVSDGQRLFRYELPNAS